MTIRFDNLPRMVWALALVLVLSAGVLWKIRSDRPAQDYTLGGPLLTYTLEEIEGLLLTRGRAQYRLDKAGPETWTLTGAITDFVDTPAMEKVLQQIISAGGGGLLPGTEPEDRRYEFNGPAAIRLTVFAADGEAISLALGTTNPVTGLVYASGAGRRSCFPVTPEFRNLLAGLPDGIRTKTLLPPFPLQSVTDVSFSDGRSETRLFRHQGRWWLLAEDSALTGLDLSARAYQALYSDRRWERDDGLWILADPNAVSLLVYEVSSPVVRQFVTPGLASATLADWNLDPPYRRVVLSGPGLNPASRYGPSDRLIVDFGLSLDGVSVPLRRLENVLLADEHSLRSLERPIAELAETDAMDFPVILADSVTVKFEGRDVLRGHRDPELFARILKEMNNDLDRVEGRRSWLLDYPAVHHMGKLVNVRVRNLVVDLDRMPILAVLPPVADDQVFLPKNRAQILLFVSDEGGARTEVLEIGWLDPERLPPESGPLVRTEEEGQPVGLWRPATGQLLQVPSQILVTIRNFGLQ